MTISRKLYRAFLFKEKLPETNEFMLYFPGEKRANPCPQSGFKVPSEKERQEMPHSSRGKSLWLWDTTQTAV